MLLFKRPNCEASERFTEQYETFRSSKTLSFRYGASLVETRLGLRNGVIECVILDLTDISVTLAVQQTSHYHTSCPSRIRIL